MRHRRPLGLVGLLLLTTGAGGWLIRHAWNLSAETQALRAASSAAAEVGRGVPPASLPSAGSAPGVLRIEDLQAQTAREVTMREAAERKIEALQSRLPKREGEVLVSFGRIDQIGQRAAKAFGAWVASAAMTAKKPSSEPVVHPAEADMAMNFFAELGAISELEKVPVEIARFHAETLRVFLGLDAPTTQRVQTLLDREFARLQTLGLTANFRPAEDFADFDARRDAAMIEVAARLRPLLPGNDPKLKLLPALLSLGGGFRPVPLPNGQGVIMMLPLLTPDLFERSE